MMLSTAQLLTFWRDRIKDLAVGLALHPSAPKADEFGNFLVSSSAALSALKISLQYCSSEKTVGLSVTSAHTKTFAVGQLKPCSWLHIWARNVKKSLFQKSNA